MANPEDVQLSWLSSFLAVVNHGTFTAAARALHRSQPRVSAHVAALEEALGTRLLHRDTRGVAITEAGTRLVPHARAAIAEVRAGMDSVESLTGELHGNLVLGSFPGASGVLLAPLIKRFREWHPDVAIELHEGSPSWLEDAVANVAVDLAIRPGDIPTQHPSVESRPLVDERVLLITPQDNELATAQPLDLHALERQAVVMTGVPSEGWTDFTRHLEDLDVTPGRIITVAHPTTVIALVRARIGVGLLGEMATAITVFGDVMSRDLPEPLWYRPIRVYWNRRRQLSRVAATFLDVLVRDAEELVSEAPA